MNLTEPQSGSDMATLKSKAERENDYYRIKGQKIYITWGEHDMVDNIIHLVLARLPDAPEGVKGISLFLVPKFLVNADGSLGERNDVKVVSTEHKLGAHASPTCVMSFGEDEGAIGYLVGEEHQGLSCMFKLDEQCSLDCWIAGRCNLGTCISTGARLRERSSSRYCAGVRKTSERLFTTPMCAGCC